MCQSLSCKHIHLYIHSEKRVRNTTLREILLQYTFKWLRVVSLTTTTKNNKHLELYQKEQMLVVTYKNTASISKPTCTELNQYIPVRACDAEEVDQKIVKRALNLPRNGFVTKWYRCHKMVQFCHKMVQVSQNGTIVTKWSLTSASYYHPRCSLE